MRSEDMGWVRSMAGMWSPPCLASSLPSTWYTLTAAPGLWDQTGVRPAGLRGHLIVGMLHMLLGGCMAPEQGAQDANSPPSMDACCVSRAAAVRATAEKDAPVAGSGCQREADLIRFRLHPPALELRSGQPTSLRLQLSLGVIHRGRVSSCQVRWLLLFCWWSAVPLGLVWGQSEPEQ